MKYIEFKRLQWAGHIAPMDNARIPTEVRNGKFCARRLVGKPRLRRGVNSRTDCSLLLNVRGRGRLEEAGNMRRRNNEEARGRRGLPCHSRRRIRRKNVMGFGIMN